MSNFTSLQSLMSNFTSLQSLIDSKKISGPCPLICTSDLYYYQQLPAFTTLFIEELSPLWVAQHIHRYVRHPITQTKALDEQEADMAAKIKRLRAALDNNFYTIVFNGKNQDSARKVDEVLNCCPALNGRILEEILQSELPDWVIYGFRLLTNGVKLLVCHIFDERCLELHLMLELGGTCDFTLRYPLFLRNDSNRDGLALCFNGEDSCYVAEEHLTDGTPNYQITAGCSSEGKPFTLFNATKTFFYDEKMS